MVDSDCPAPERDKLKDMNDKNKKNAAKKMPKTQQKELANRSEMLTANIKELAGRSEMATANIRGSAEPNLEPAALGMSMHPVMAASMRDMKNKPELIKFLRKDRERLDKIFAAI